MRAARRALLSALACTVVLCGAAWPGDGVASAGAAPTQDAYKHLPLKRDKEETGSSAWTVVAILAGLGVGVVLLTSHRRQGGAAWPTPALSRWAARRALPRRMAVVERLGLHAGCAVYLVRWDDEEVLLGCTSQSVSLIGRRPVADRQAEDS